MYHYFGVNSHTLSIMPLLPHTVVLTLTQNTTQYKSYELKEFSSKLVGNKTILQFNNLPHKQYRLIWPYKTKSRNRRFPTDSAIVHPVLSIYLFFL